MDSDNQIELIPVNEIQRGGRGGRGGRSGRGGRRGRGKGRGHGRDGYDNFREEEAFDDSQSGEEKEESQDLISHHLIIFPNIYFLFFLKINDIFLE